MASVRFDIQGPTEDVQGSGDSWRVTLWGNVVGNLYDGPTGHLLDSLSNEVYSVGLGSTRYEAMEWARHEWRDRVSERKSFIGDYLMRR